MASTGKRVRTVFAELVGRKPESIQDSDELSDYGFGRTNFFSLLEKMEKKLGKHWKISDSDIIVMMQLKTVKDLINLIERISEEQHKEVRNNASS